MKIYTKTGDSGTTALVGGERVAKNSERIEAYGTVDELISYIALLRDSKVDKSTSKFLLLIQHDLMVASAILATNDNKIMQALPKLSASSVVKIEKEIDKLEKNLPVLSSFLIPGGHAAVSICHICRTVCRRTERRIYDVMDKSPLPEIISVYFNRLSDYLFVLSRSLSKYFGSKEIIWKPKLDNKD